MRYSPQSEKMAAKEKVKKKNKKKVPDIMKISFKTRLHLIRIIHR